MATRRYPKLPQPPRHFVAPRSPGHHVADFNTLDDLIAHARDELGATHVLVDDANTKLYFPRGGQHSYEEASVWRKSGYWHAQGPGSRTGVRGLPEEAQPIGGGRAERRAAEASGTTKRIALKSERAMTPLGGRTDTMWVIYDVDTGETLSAGTDEQAERDRFKHMTTSGERFGDSGTRFIAAETRGRAGRRAAEAPQGRQVESSDLARRFPRGWTLAKHLMDWSYRRKGAVEVISTARIIKQGYSVDQVRQALTSSETFEHYDGKVYQGSDGSGGLWRVEITEAGLGESCGTTETPRGHAVRDYIAVDRRGRTTAGPFKTYGDAKSAAGPADVVQFVSREGVEEARHSEAPSRAYIIEAEYPPGSGRYARFPIDQSWATKTEAERYATRWFSSNDKWRVVLLRERTAEARRSGGGRQATKPGKHGTLHLWRITYKDSNNPAFGEASFQKWAYDKQAAWDDFNEEVGSEGESWEIVKIEPILDTGPKQLSREARRTGGTRGGPARKYYVVDQVQNGIWVQVGHFATKDAAERFRAKLHGQTRIHHAFPSGHDHPPIAEEARRRPKAKRSVRRRR